MHILGIQFIQEIDLTKVDMIPFGYYNFGITLGL